MTGCRWPLFNATQQYFNSQSPHFAVDSGTRLKIALCNSYASETVGGSTMTYTAAIWSASGSSLVSLLGQFLFSGSASGTCAPGALLESDWLSLNYTAGTQYIIRLWGNGPSGMPFFQCPVGNSDTAHGALYENSATVLADKTTSGAAISPSSFANSFSPIAVIGDTKLPSILCWGDSLTCQGAANHGDTFDGTSPRVGFPDRVLGASGYAGINCGVPGETLATFVSNHTVRLLLQKYVSGVWSNYGINDLGPSTAAAIFANMQTIEGYPTAKTFIQGQIGYEDTSTDSFITPGNQTPQTNFTVGGKIDTLNGQIPTLTGARISDHRSAVFVIGSNIWKSDGSTAFLYTPDGTHNSQFAAKLIASSGVVPASMFAR